MVNARSRSSFVRTGSTSSQILEFYLIQDRMQWFEVDLCDASQQSNTLLCSAIVNELFSDIIPSQQFADYSVSELSIHIIITIFFVAFERVYPRDFPRIVRWLIPYEKVEFIVNSFYRVWQCLNNPQCPDISIWFCFNKRSNLCATSPKLIANWGIECSTDPHLVR